MYGISMAVETDFVFIQMRAYLSTKDNSILTCMVLTNGLRIF